MGKKRREQVLGWCADKMFEARHWVENASDGFGDLKDDVREAGAQFARGFAAASDGLGDELKKSAKEAAQSAGATLQAAAGHTLDAATTVTSGAVDLVKENPGKTALIVTAAVATGGGALLGASAIGAVVSAAGFGAAGGTLSGAAASSAGLAFLGGGSIVAGGAGMAGGVAVCGATGTALGLGLSSAGVAIHSAVTGDAPWTTAPPVLDEGDHHEDCYY